MMVGGLAVSPCDCGWTGGGRVVLIVMVLSRSPFVVYSPKTLYFILN